MIQLTFETVGRNTQMNFLELVILGGGWLFLVAYLVNKLKNKIEKKQSTVSTIFMLLLVTCFWLVPPVLNILRVLLTVYIPMFGLTARRLFGIYTTVAFVITFLYVLWGGWKKDENFFAKTTISFFLSIILLSFAVPTNLLIADWHISRYLTQGTKADFDYFKKLKLEKWGWVFQSQFDTATYKSDIIWGLALAERQGDKAKQQEYKEVIRKLGIEEMNDMLTLINSNRMTEFMEKYSTNSASLSKNYVGAKVLHTNESLHKKFVKSLNSSPYITHSYRRYPFIIMIEASHEVNRDRPSLLPTTSLFPTATPAFNFRDKIYIKYAEYRSDSTLLKIDSAQSTKL